MFVDVPLTNNRLGRRAELELRYEPVVLELRPRGGGITQPAPLFAVHAREISALPKGEAPIEWLLVTNKEGQTAADAEQVVMAYSKRWRIEEVHKSWKSVTNVEDSALESLHAFSIWATILFSIAGRVEPLKYLSRTQPESPASIEFDAIELEVLQKRRRQTRPDMTMPEMTIELAVRWVADMGGYMNPHQGPPGTLVLARGLRRLRMLVDGFQLREL